LEDGVKVPKGKPGRKRNIAKHMEIPAIPDGESVATLQFQQKDLKEACETGQKDLQYQRQMMDNTFPLRRREVVLEDVRVWKLLKEYPPLAEGQGNEASIPLLFFVYYIHFVIMHTSCNVIG
jgi:hypothetical protein